MIKNALPVQEILKRVPHRFPFLLLDRIVEFKKDEYIVGLKNVTLNEPFFHGHFPGRPVLPGVLMIEMAAQAALMFVHLNHPEGWDDALYFLGDVKRFRFMKPVTPGEQLKIRVETVKQISTAAIVKADLTVSGEQVATGELSFGRAAS